MRQILIIISTVLITSIVMGIIAAFAKGQIGYFFYVGMLMIGNIIIPITIAEILYEIISRKILFKNTLFKLLIEIILLIILFQIGFLIWSVLDLISYYEGFEGISIENIKQDFKKEFQGYVLISILVAFLIPILDKIIRGNNPTKSANM